MSANANESSRTPLPTSEHCFVCGEENPAGLQGRFYVEGAKVKLRLNAKPSHCGYDNTVHGGVIAAALDECMAWAGMRAIQRMCYTAELTVRYLRPLTLDADAVAETEVVRATARLIEARGEMVGADGTVYARAVGKFMPLTAEQTLAVDDALRYRGDEERVFDALRQERQPG